MPTRRTFTPAFQACVHSEVPALSPSGLRLPPTPARWAWATAHGLNHHKRQRQRASGSKRASARGCEAAVPAASWARPPARSGLNARRSAASCRDLLERASARGCEAALQAASWARPPARSGLNARRSAASCRDLLERASARGCEAALQAASWARPPARSGRRPRSVPSPQGQRPAGGRAARRGEPWLRPAERKPVGAMDGPTGAIFRYSSP